MTKQLTNDDVARLYKERKYDDINQARDEGRLDTVLGEPAERVALLERGRHGAITRDDVVELNRLHRHDLVTQALTEGRITDLNPTEGN